MLVFRHEVLLAARLELGLTQEDVARSLQIDVRTYRRYEAGSVNDPVKGFSVRRAGRRQLLAQIGEQLGIAAEELVGPPTPAEPQTPQTPQTQEPERFSTRHAHVLQPARHFVGRQAQLAALREWLEADEGPRIYAIVAVGGAGKSALTQALLDSLPDDDPGSRALLVWSFYEDTRVEGFLGAALQALGLPSSELPTAPMQMLERLLERVAGEPRHLLVLDGLETMQSDGRTRPRGSIEDPHLRRLLSTIAGQPGGTRVLVTSRYPLVDLSTWDGRGLHTLMLPPLGAEAQAQLLESFGIRCAPQEARLLLERFGGHALSVATAASYVAGFHDGHLEAIDGLALDEAVTDDPLAYRLARLLEAYAAAMTEAQRDLVTRVSAFPRGAEIDALLSLARQGGPLAGQMPTERRAMVRALSRLEAMGVLYRSRATASIYAVHPFIADTFRERLGPTRADLHDAEQRRLLDRIAERPTPRLHGEQLDLLEDLLVHTLLAGHATAAISIYLRTMGGFATLGLERGDMSRGLRLLRSFFVDADLERPRSGLHPYQHGQVLYELALYASAMGNPRLARQALMLYVDVVRDDPPLHTTGWRTTAYVLRLEGRPTEALDAIGHALRIGAKHPDHVVRNLALRGAILHDLQDRSGAERCFAQANAIDPRPRYRRALWEAELRVEQGDIESATALARDTRRDCENRGWSGHTSHCDVVLGHCLADTEPQAAAAHLSQALRWANASGEVEAQLRCLELELRLLPADSREVTHRRALALVEESGFVRFAPRLER